MAKNAAIIMAAGLGTRMKSQKPKILHEVCGVPMLQWVINALKPLKLEKIIVILGKKNGEEFKLIKGNIHYVIQKQKKGTGHAVKQALPLLKGFTGNVLILSGDVPLIQTETLKNLITEHQKSYAVSTILTADVEKPFGYGRILRQADQVFKIVEELDADDHTKKIKEINTGTYCFKNKILQDFIPKIKMNALKKEYYLTDIFSLLNQEGSKIIPLKINDPTEVMGVNRRYELEKANKIMQKRIQKKLMDKGVTILDGDNTYIDANVSIGQDTIIYPFSLLYENTKIGANCKIGPSAHITNCKIGEFVEIHNSVLTGSRIENGVRIGPFSHIRNATVIKKGAHIGNFVEITRSVIGADSRAYHLSYLGDATLGEDVNLGAGIITANWDAEKQIKNKTKIGDHSKIGSNTVIIAPASVPANEVIPSHSLVHKNKKKPRD